MNEPGYWRSKWIGELIAPPNAFAKRALKLIVGKNLRSLLDVGCGDGRDALYFSKKGLKVTALDLSESGIGKLKRQGARIRCRLVDIRNASLAENSFDIIYAHLSLHYFDDETTSRIFKKLFRALKMGGLMFVKCKSTEDPLFGKGRRIGENMYAKGHIRHFFTTEYMREKLRGFKVIKIIKTRSSYDGFHSAFIEAIASK